MKMNLELGITIGCTEIGCQVQCVSDDRVISTNYSALVLDRIRIRKQQLVAIDTSPLIPEIVWRWVRAIVLEVNDESVGIEDCLGQIEFASRVSELPLRLSIGDEIWFCNTDQELEVHDLIVNGKPAHPDQLIEYITPIIKRVYAT
jgi:hypothetical protein